MALKPDYTCTECGRTVKKDDLKVKRAVFREMGKGGPVVKTRVTAWLCAIPQEDGSPSCLHLDPDWNRPLYSSSPGMKGTVLDDEARGGEEVDEPLFPPIEEIIGLSEHLAHPS